MDAGPETASERRTRRSAYRDSRNAKTASTRRSSSLVTGLSRHYCWKARAGKKLLHPMHWHTVLDLARDRGLSTSDSI